VRRAMSWDQSYEKMLEFFEGSSEILGEMYKIFKKKYPERMDAISKSIESKKAGDLSCAAHSLKGAADYFQVERISILAEELEMMGEIGEFDGSAEKLLELRKYLDEFFEYMDTKFVNS
jgi:HPt (histidine-containing phosphotransfer) domain-containing protein